MISPETQNNIRAYYRNFLLIDYMEIFSLHFDVAKTPELYDLIREFTEAGTQIATSLETYGLQKDTFSQVVVHLRKYRHSSFEEFLKISQVWYPSKLEVARQRILSLEESNSMKTRNYEAQIQTTNKSLERNMHTITEQQAEIARLQETTRIQNEAIQYYKLNFKRKIKAKVSDVDCM